MTAAGCLIHQDKILLIKHKKVGTWLNPGGHIDPNELPHHAAEREFWEETGIKVQTYQLHQIAPSTSTLPSFVPAPFSCNLHWMSEQRYQQRLARQSGLHLGQQPVSGLTETKTRACEQHLTMMYLVKPVAGVEFTQNIEETDGIAWFTRVQIIAHSDDDIWPAVKAESLYALDLETHYQLA